MKCIFTGGGTLGHTNPAIAVAQKIQEINSDTEILFVMREGGKENSAVTKRGFRMIEIPSSGLQRKCDLLGEIKTLKDAIFGISKSLKIIKSFKPDLIFGTGGYVSFAPLIAGLIKGIPTFVHESNSTPGLVTRIAVKLGATPLVNMPETKSILKSKNECAIVGMPVLSDFRNITKKEARETLGIPIDKILIISFGGSGGSATMNEIIMNSMSKCAIDGRRNILHIHATGEKYFADAKNKYFMLFKGMGGQRIVPKIDNMNLYMCAADIVICRCGAATLSEISAVGKAAILIPSPNVTDNHQYKNGKFFVDKDAAVMIEEKDLTEDLLTEKITTLATSLEMRKRLENNILKLKKADAADVVARILLNAR